MKIGVFGANGKTGTLVAREALNRGHSIVAGVRGDTILKSSDNLEIFQCDVLNKDQVNDIVKKSDVVVSVIGHVKGSPEFMQSYGITNIIDSMKKYNKTRLVSLTGTGVRFPEDKITFIDKILNFSINLIDPKRIADGKKHVEIIKKSKLDWTVIRVLKLQNTKATNFSLSKNGPAKTITARAEVATAIINVIEQVSFVKNAPIISKLNNNRSDSV